jgi:large subunit ribosomal protein L3
MGDARQTVRNLKVEKVDPARNLIYVRGAVPGARNSVVLIKKMVSE